VRVQALLHHPQRLGNDHRLVGVVVERQAEVDLVDPGHGGHQQDQDHQPEDRRAEDPAELPVAHGQSENAQHHHDPEGGGNLVYPKFHPEEQKGMAVKQRHRHVMGHGQAEEDIQCDDHPPVPGPAKETGHGPMAQGQPHHQQDDENPEDVRGFLQAQFIPADDKGRRARQQGPEVVNPEEDQENGAGPPPPRRPRPRHGLR